MSFVRYIKQIDEYLLIGGSFTLCYGFKEVKNAKVFPLQNNHMIHQSVKLDKD